MFNLVLYFMKLAFRQYEVARSCDDVIGHYYCGLKLILTECQGVMSTCFKKRIVLVVVDQLFRRVTSKLKNI